VTRKADWGLVVKECWFHLEWAENEAFALKRAVQKTQKIEAQMRDWRVGGTFFLIRSLVKTLCSGTEQSDR